MTTTPRRREGNGRLKAQKAVKRTRKSPAASLAKTAADQIASSPLTELAIALGFSPAEVTRLTKSFNSTDRLMHNNSELLAKRLGISVAKSRALQIALVWRKFGISSSLAAALGLRRLDLIRVRGISAEELTKELDASHLPIAPSEKSTENLRNIISATRMALPVLRYRQTLSDLGLSNQTKRILKSEKVNSFADILKLKQKTLKKIGKEDGVTGMKKVSRLIGYAKLADVLNSPGKLYAYIPANFIAKMRLDVERIKKLKSMAAKEMEIRTRMPSTIERRGKDKSRPRPLQIIPSIHPPGVFIPSLPDWWQRRFTPRRTRGIAPRTDPGSLIATPLSKFRRAEKKIDLRKIPQGRLNSLAIAAPLNLRKRRNVATSVDFIAQRNDLELLRVLIFDESIELTQTICHEGLEYNLNNPSREYRPNTYCGYVIAADEILLTTDINTNGHHLVLVASRITGPRDGPIEIRTEPAPMGKPDYPVAGNHADNGGDVVLVTKEFQNMSNMKVIASGGRGQDGGDGKDMSQPVAVRIEKEEEESFPGTTFGVHDINGTLVGTAVNVQFPSGSGFYDGSCWIKDPLDETKFATPPAGIYGIIGSVDDAAWRTNVRIGIEPQYYPTNGRAPGYGGYPGKVKLVMPELPIGTLMRVTAETGADGMPGKGGSGGELTPQSLYLPDGSIQPLPIQDYINRKTRSKIRETGRRDPNAIGSLVDRFRRLQTEPRNNALERSIATIGFEGAIKVLYYADLEAKRAGDESRLQQTYAILPILNNVKLYSRCVLSANIYLRFGNIIPYSPTRTPHWPNSLSITLSKAPDGEPLESRVAVSESLEIIQSNWYREVFTLIPQYPERLAKRAERLFRGGDFDGALPIYREVITFSEESDFDAPELVSEAAYRIDLGLAGLDYFGFDANTIIPISPSREIDQITYYSAAVRFYNESIRGVLASQLAINQLITLLEQFDIDRERLMDQISDSMNLTRLEIVALDLDIDAVRHEIDALFRANIRMCNLLTSWWQRVNDKVAEIEAQPPEEPSDWVLVWNFLKLFASIVAAVYSYGAAASKAADAWEELGNAVEEGNRVVALIDDMNEIIDTLTEGGFRERLENLAEAISAFDDTYRKFFKLVGETVDLILEAIEKTEDMQAKLAELRTTSDQWTQQEAIDFRNNVLLADEIDVSGAMTYLQIEEQITLNNDLVIAKQLALQATITRRRALTVQLMTLARQLARHQLDRSRVQQTIEDYQVGVASNALVISQLNEMGQAVLDSMMHRLQEHAFQMKFLNLDTTPLKGGYDRFIDSPVDIGYVLQWELDIREQIADWTAANANIGRVKVIRKRTGPIEPGTLTQIVPEVLDNFTRGEFNRPSVIFRLEPLRETRFVQSVGIAIASRLTTVDKLADYLSEQFSNAYDIVGEYQVIVDRERLYHPVLNVSAVGYLDDEEVVLAYTLALGGVTTPLLSNLLLMTGISTLLRTRLQKLSTIWDLLSAEISNEDVKSLRAISESIQAQTMTDNQIMNFLVDNLMDGNSFIHLSNLHLQEQDIQAEIESSYDSYFPNSLALGGIHNGDDFRVVLAVILLYAGVDEAQLQSVAGQFPIGHVIGDRLKHLQGDWAELRRSALERQHALIIRVAPDDLLALPNNANTFAHRVLTVRSVLKAGSSALSYSLVVRKIPIDLFRQDTELVEMTFLDAEQLSFPENIATPTGLNLDDYHTNQLFGRGLMGEWEVMLTNKGNQQALPAIDEVEVEFLYMFQRAGQI